jgi:hypothetical protein
MVNKTIASLARGLGLARSAAVGVLNAKRQVAAPPMPPLAPVMTIVLPGTAG